MPLIRISRAVLTVGLIAFSSAGVSAQTLSPDEKELASYRLTMPTLKKVIAALEGFTQEMSKDPKIQERAKLRAQIKALEEKEQLTETQQAELEKLQEREQALDEEIERADEANGTRNPKTIAEMEAAITQQPAAMRALAAQGLSPREYARCLMALLQASMVEGFSQGKADLAKLPPGVNPENVKFVREHKEELAAMKAAMSGK